MRLNAQEIGMGLVIVVCKCCGNVHKAHESSNTLAHSLTPGYGCKECQGIPPKLDQCKVNCDTNTIERILCDAKNEITRLRAGLEYLKDNFPANECLQDKCREVLGAKKRKSEDI